MSDYCYGFARIYRKADILQHRDLFVITKPDLLEFNLSSYFSRRIRSDLRWRNKISIVHHPEHSFTCNHSHLQYIEFISNHAQWTEEQVEIEMKGDDLSNLIFGF